MCEQGQVMSCFQLYIAQCLSPILHPQLCSLGISPTSLFQPCPVITGS